MRVRQVQTLLCWMIWMLLFCSAAINRGVNAKGAAKVRPNKRLNNREQNRYPVSSSGSEPTNAEDPSNYHTAFLFRNATYEERLLAYLFRDYDPVARAVMDVSRPVVVSINFVLLRIHGLEERSQVLTTTGLVIAEWRDERLHWNPTKFGALTDIIVKSEQVWLPELAVMNGAEELMPDFDRMRVLLHHDGRLHWEPGGIFRTTCDIDITYFPFDSQHCPILVGAYSYYSSRMNITNASDNVSTHDLQQNGEWHVYSTSVQWAITVLDCCPGNGYSHVIFTLHLKRRYKFYMMNIVLPCLMLSVLIMIGFFLPPEAGEKISLGISVLLAFTVFLLMIADNIPRTSLAIPLIVVYLMATMTLGTLSICMTVVVLNFHHRDPHSKVPVRLRRLILIHLARLLRVETSYLATCQRQQQVWKRHRHRHHYDGHRRPFRNAVIDGLEFLSLTAASSSSSRTNHHHHHHKHPSPPPPPNNTQTGNGTLAPSGGDLNTYSRLTWRSSIYARAMGDDGTGRGGTGHDGPGGTGRQQQQQMGQVTEWREMARVLDRAFFWLICVMMTSSAVFILLYPKYMGMEDGWYPAEGGNT